MVLTKEKFTLYELDESKRQDIIPIRLNEREREWLETQKVTLQQEKDATAFKQLAAIGAKVIHDTPQGEYFTTVLNNLRKNKRLGIVEVERKKPQK